MHGVMFLVLRSVISSDSNVTEVYVEAEETAAYSTSVTPSSTRWEYRDSLKRETKRDEIRKMCSFVCLLSDHRGPIQFTVCYLVVGTISLMHILLLQIA
jgi:hypothetical protein